MSSCRGFNRHLTATVVCLLCSYPLAGVVRGEDFNAIQVAAEVQRSREFAVRSSLEVLHGCLAVIQDIRFHVTETEVEPGLIVAQSPGALGYYTGHVLTASVQPVTGSDNSFQVRLSMTAQHARPDKRKLKHADYSSFYQDFFARLNLELFREGGLP